jgi:polysaccharide chain length determinant protein (PEP-CTERM system associated)
MQELLDKVIEEIKGAWRFRRPALIAAWAVAVIGWTVVFMLPDVYLASTRVFVDTKTALKPVLAGLSIDQDVNAQLNLVRNSLLAGAQLETIARDVGLLDATHQTPQKRAQVVNSMRDSITMTIAIDGTPNAEPDRDAGRIYTIQYKDVSRDRSMKVVETLQNLLVENTLGGKRTGSESAQRFLSQQIQEYESRLRESEDRLAEFKKRNVGLMPQEEGGYFPRLQTEMDAVTTAQSALAVALSRREELQRQLRGEAPIAAATGFSGSNNQGGPSGGDTLSRVKETQARLDELLLRFTDKHPDVVATRENLEQLKERRTAELDALRRGDPNAAAASGASSNPVYQSIQLQLNQTDVEIASLRRTLADHQGKVAELRKMLDTMPQVEAEYARLNRDYDVTKANYTALVERLEKSRIGDDATSSGSVRFDVIDPAFASFKPASPPRNLLIVAILPLSLLLGVGIAYVLHQLRPVYTSARSLAESTGLQVLGAISMSWLETKQSNLRRSYVRYSVALFGLFVVAVVVLQLSRMGVRLLPAAV